MSDSIRERLSRLYRSRQRLLLRNEFSHKYKTPTEKIEKFNLKSISVNSVGRVNWDQADLVKKMQEFQTSLDSVFANPNSENPVSKSLKKSPQLKKLFLAFQRSWNRKYEDYRARHRARVSPSSYKKTAWYRYKVENYRKLPGPWYRPSRKIDSKAQGLATGFLKRSIGDSFKSGGGKYIKLSINVTEISWEWRTEEYDRLYTKWLETVTPYMQDIGVVEKNKPFVDFLDDDWQDIIAIMTQIYVSGPAEGIIKMINDLIIKRV
jgi:hypothetical protein